MQTAALIKYQELYLEAKRPILCFSLACINIGKPKRKTVTFW